MTTTPTLEMQSSRFRLRPLEEADIGERYLNWLKDPVVTRFLDVKAATPTIEKIRTYVASFDHRRKFLWGIFTLDEVPIHVGNISLYDIHEYHRNGHYGYMIGDKDYWGSGAAVDAIAMVFDFAFNVLGLHSVSGGSNIENTASIFNFNKMGLTYSGTIKERLWFEGRFVDMVTYSITCDEWKLNRKRYPQITTLHREIV